MQGRKVRVTAFGVRVRFGDAAGDLVNMSVSGALVRLDRDVPIGTANRLAIGFPEPIAVNARVVRLDSQSRGGGPTATPRWVFAVTFVSPTPQEVSALRAGIVELHKRAAEPPKPEPTPVTR